MDVDELCIELCIELQRRRHCDLDVVDSSVLLACTAACSRFETNKCPADSRTAGLLWPYLLRTYLRQTKQQSG